MLHRLRVHQDSFNHAIEGLVYTFKTQPHFRFHLLAAVVVTILGYYLQITISEWVVVILAVNLVMVCEMLNTSIESMVDLITLERREDAKIAKDVAAGMVLLSSVMAVIIGLIVFIPKILILA